MAAMDERKVFRGMDKHYAYDAYIMLSRQAFRNLYLRFNHADAKFFINEVVEEDMQNYDLLIICVMYDLVEEFERLVESRDIDEMDDEGWTPYGVAMKHDTFKNHRHLFEKSKIAKTRTNWREENCSELYHALLEPTAPRFQEVLHRRDWNDVIKKEELLHTALLYNRLDEFKMMVEHGADPHAIHPHYDETHLFDAFRFDNIEFIEYLMSLGINHKHINNADKTADICGSELTRKWFRATYK